MNFNVDVNIKTTGKTQIDELEKQIQQLKSSTISVKLDVKNSDVLKQIKEFNKKIKIPVDTSGLSKGTQEINKLKSSMNQLQKFKVKIDTKGVDVDLSNIENKIKRFNTQAFTPDQKNQVNSITQSFRELQSLVSSFKGKDVLDDSDLQQYNTQLKTVQNQVKLLSNELSSMATIDDRMTFSNKIETWLKNNTKVTEQAKAQLQDYIDTLRNAGTSMTSGDFNSIRKGFTSVTSEMKAAGKTGKGAFDDFKRAFSQIFQFAGAYGVIQNVAFEVPRQMVQAVRDINAAQIELTKVSDGTPAQLSAYWEEAAASAGKYGAKINEVINSTADWSRLGYGLEEAKQLSDATTLMQRIGDNMTQQSSSEGLVSTLQGFQLEADEVMRVVDKINEVANTQPIDTAGLFAGLQRSASSMKAANNTLEQTIALITAGNAVMQDPDRVGNGLKTISMRIRGATTELEAAGESTEGMATSTASLRKEVMALSGVDIMKDSTTFKSTYDILDELSEKWSDLTDIQQANSCLYVQKCA